MPGLTQCDRTCFNSLQMLALEGVLKYRDAFLLIGAFRFLVFPGRDKIFFIASIWKANIDNQCYPYPSV